MRKALHLINSLDLKNGGPSVTVPGLMLATAEGGKYANRLLQFGRELSEQAIGPRTNVSTLKRSVVQIPLNMLLGGEMSSAIKEADVVHVHGLWEPHCIMSGVLARRHCKPFIVSAHGMLERWAIRNKRWKKWPYSLMVERPNLRRTTMLRALTLSEVDDYRRFGLTNPVAVIPNGIDLTGKTSSALFLSMWPELKDKRLVLFLSRIHYKKGVDLLVKAWANITTQFPDVHLVIAGPDSEGTQRAAEQMVKEQSIGERVTFTGAVYGDLKASLLGAASLFVLPSHSEGFSVAILESLAAGVPVIITNGCNFPEVATSGSGWVVRASIAEIEGALQEALASSEIDLQCRAHRGLQLVRSKYSWSQIGKQMADVYDWMLGGDRPSSLEICE
jgi:glycosyltransferase involved in cell wall biosynthesis